jgi:hypothetical protein
MSLTSGTSVQRELTSGERLLWEGRRRGGVKLRGSDFFLIPFSLLWGGFAIVWESMALFVVPKNNPAGWVFPLFGIPFVLAGLYIIFGRFIVDAKMRARTEYALTNRRAIIISGLFARKVRSINLQSTPEITLSEKKRWERHDRLWRGPTVQLVGTNQYLVSECFITTRFRDDRKSPRRLQHHRKGKADLTNPVVASAYAAKRARSCGFWKSTGVPLGMIPVGLTRVIE